MDSFLSTALAKLDEVEANAAFLSSVSVIIREDKSSLYAAYSQQGAYGGEKSARLAKTLVAAKADFDSVLQGLVVVLSGVLESYLASAVDMYIYRASKAGTHWTPEQLAKIRSRYLSRAGIGLSQMPTGRFYKMRFNFSRMLDNLRITLDDKQPDRMSGDVFMVRFGTCSPEKIEGLFEDILVSPPFDPDLGTTSYIQKWYASASGNSAGTNQDRSDFVRVELDRLAGLRNEFAHGLATQTVTFSDIEAFTGAIRSFLFGVADRLLVKLS